MKKIQLVFLMMISVVVLIPKTSYAEAFINNNGIVISDEEYENFSKIKTYEYLMTMNEEQYQRLLSFDYDNLIVETKYFETTYNPHLNLTTEKEITKEQYEIMPMLNGGGASAETSAKKIVMGISSGDTYQGVSVGVSWKGIPSTRKFDVIGIRTDGFEVREGSQIGQQIYKLNGEYETIYYKWNGANTKRFDNGFGISMNIVDSDITVLQIALDCDIKATETHPSIFASYQHAVNNNITLVQSQNYTLGGAGLGGVFVYPYAITEKYDGMTGIRVEW